MLRAVKKNEIITGMKPLGLAWGRRLYYVRPPVPLLGSIAFGVIDRGTNVLQVRPTTLCPLNCIFCSVDAGPRSRLRQAEYIVDPHWLVEWVKVIAAYKQVHVEALIDGVGEPLTYPYIVELVAMLKRTPGVKTVAIETHGATLNYKLILKLNDAGLDRINLSIDTLNTEKAKMLTGVEWYDVNRVMRLAEFIAKETDIDLHVTPVWLPGVNDKDVVDVVKWAIRIGAGKKWPPVTIQKYIAHKYGRKPKGVREVSWHHFWRWLSDLEKRIGVKLHYSMDEWGMMYAKKVPEPYKRGEIIEATIISLGWLKNELLAVDNECKRIITIILRDNELKIGETVRARIIRSRDNIYIAELV